jgi:hypothetical protein
MQIWKLLWETFRNLPVIIVHVTAFPTFSTIFFKTPCQNLILAVVLPNFNLLHSTFLVQFFCTTDSMRSSFFSFFFYPGNTVSVAWTCDDFCVRLWPPDYQTMSPPPPVSFEKFSTGTYTGRGNNQKWSSKWAAPRTSVEAGHRISGQCWNP